MIPKRNPLLKKLGLGENDRAVILHADDIGMCQATLSAYADAVDFGLLSSASVMVPCPWFQAAAEYCRDQPDLDVGVHLTLTSEWSGYRWGPLSTRDPSSGLLDEQGYFHAGAKPVQSSAPKDRVTLELRTQIERALEAGIHVTHIDAHMFAVIPTFLDVYFRLAQQYGLPAAAYRASAERWDVNQLHGGGYSQETVREMAHRLEETEERGLPLLDGWFWVSDDHIDNRLEMAKAALDRLPPGITYFLFHPAKDTPELRQIAPDWRMRVGDYELLIDPDFRDYVHQSPIQVLDWRTIASAM
jgi:hypothetical protein